MKREIGISPQQQPVAWLVPSDETGFCRIWWRDKESADVWIAKHPTCTLVPLYAAPTKHAEELEEAGRGAIAIRNELDRVRAERASWESQFHSAAAAASEYSEFWEKHHGDFDQFGNYVPYSQMDGDLRAAKARIAELEAALSLSHTADTGVGKP
jgi:hypothetical protein